MNWIFKPFDELTSAEIYDSIHLRESVFVVEQNCAYLDCDNKDQESWHLLGYKTDSDKQILVAYLRVVPAGLKYKEASIGRVVTHQGFRSQGLGRSLMEKAMQYAHTEMNYSSLRISAQAYLEKFYSDFGFKKVSEEYLEDGIPHIEMLWVAESN